MSEELSKQLSDNGRVHDVGTKVGVREMRWVIRACSASGSTKLGKHMVRPRY